MITRIFLNNLNFPKTSWPRFSNYDKARIWITMIPHLWISTKNIGFQCRIFIKPMKTSGIQRSRMKKWRNRHESWAVFQVSVWTPKNRRHFWETGHHKSRSAKKKTIWIWGPHAIDVFWEPHSTEKNHGTYGTMGRNFMNPSQTCRNFMGLCGGNS